MGILRMEVTPELDRPFTAALTRRIPSVPSFCRSDDHQAVVLPWLSRYYFVEELKYDQYYGFDCLENMCLSNINLCVSIYALMACGSQHSHRIKKL